MKTLVTGGLFLLLSHVIHAQDVIYEWAGNIGGTSTDFYLRAVPDTSGNVIGIGHFGGTANVDPTAGSISYTSAGGDDLFIQKLDASGNLVWSRQIGGVLEDETRDLKVDAAGNIYVAGYFEGSVDFDPGAGVDTYTASSRDGFVLKLDTNGDYVWMAHFAGSGNEHVTALDITNSGHIMCGGVFSQDVDLNPGFPTVTENSLGQNDVFIVKLNSSGSYLWGRVIGGTSNQYLFCLDSDANNDVYGSGYFSGTTDFDPGAGTYNLGTNGGTSDAYVVKLDANYNFEWASTMGGNGTDQAREIVCHSNGNVYVSGIFESTADFDPGVGVYNVTSNGGYDAYFQRLNGTTGANVWCYGIGASGDDQGTALAEGTNGDLYFGGSFQSTVDFEIGVGTYNLTSTGSDDAFLARYQSGGYLVWAESMGGTATDQVSHISLDASDNLYISGFFAGNGDYDPQSGVSTLTSNGVGDGFVAKYSQCAATAAIDVKSACESYTWIDGVTYTTSNTTATHTLTNAAGCDSVVTLNLTILSPTAATDVITACGSHTWIDGITYTASNNSVTHTLTNSAGCDSVVTLDLTVVQVDVWVDENGDTLEATATNATFQWIDCADSSEIPGATNAAFVPEATGQYAVIVEQNGCSEISSCYYMAVNGAEELDQASWSIAPNPSSGVFTVHLDETSGSARLEMLDAHGRRILERTFTGSHTIDATEVQQGIYFISLYQNDQFSMKRVVIH